MSVAATYLYKFTMGGEVFRYTSNSTDVVIDLGDGNETFTAASISSQDIRGSFIEGAGEIIMPDSLRPASDFKLGAPNTRIFIQSWDREGVPSFGGFVENCRFSVDARSATLRIIPGVFSRSMIPPRSISPMCDYNLGDSRCTVDLGALAVTGTSVVVSGGGLVLTSSAWEVGDGFFTGGFVSFGDQRALIVAHTGGALTLFRAFRTGTGNYVAFPGCDKSETTCNAKFSNIDNFGGFDRVPDFNPSARDWGA